MILSDNQGALDISEDPTNYQRAKHIDIRYHFIRHALHSDQISIDYIPSTENPADILTKALEPVKHQHCVELMNLSYRRIPERKEYHECWINIAYIAGMFD